MPVAKFVWLVDILSPWWRCGKLSPIGTTVCMYVPLPIWNWSN